MPIFWTDIPEIKNLDLQFTENFEEFKLSNDFKVIILQENATYENYLKETERILYFSTICDLLFLKTNEFHYYHYSGDINFDPPDIFSQIKFKKNIFYILPGWLDDQSLFKKRLLFSGDWLNQVKQLYVKLDYKLKLLKPYEKKFYYFDSLLGNEKPHRTFIANKINESIFCKKFLLSYKINYFNKGWFDDEDIVYLEKPNNFSSNFTFSSAEAKYENVLTSVSKVLPINVYNSSYFSIIAETNYKNGIIFPTEKTAKPLIAKRLFIIFSSVNFLKNLRMFGFKTFNNVIDESYDSEIDDFRRWNSAWKQVEYLCNCNQEMIIEKIKPIVEHNFNHLMNFDFDQFVQSQIKEIINKNQL